LPALTVLGLVILAAFVVSVFAIGYVYSQKLAELRRAREAALDVDAEVQAAIVTGADQTVDITIPSGFTIHFRDNQVLIDDSAYPEGGYPWPITGPELGHGTYTLTIRIGDNLIMVEKV
jgi:hypothetical protein